jgi:hypothetical protein
MTDRATFGDFALAARRHLDAAVEHSSTDTWPLPGVLAAEIHEFTYGLHRVLKLMGRYLADTIEATDADPRPPPQSPSPWDRAARKARAAVQKAYLGLPLTKHSDSLQPPPQTTGSFARDLRAAVTAMRAGRDLLHTHFASVPEGGRQFRSEWAPVITSESGRRALMAELAGWARQIVTLGTELTNSPGIRSPETAAEECRALAACRWLSAMTTALDNAQSLEPATDDEISQLHAVPAGVLQPRRRPGRTETVRELRQGIADCAERVRRAATTDLPDPALASWITAESFHQAAAHATVISHNCEILQQALAARAVEHGNARLSRHLMASAQVAARARVAWLTAAQAWLYIKTDAYGDIAPAANEVVDLALWTGRLAYADPHWTPTVGPDHTPRSPQELAPEPADVGDVLAAVQQAGTTLTTIAAIDYTQIRAAGLSGRLLVPTVKPGSSSQIDQTFVRAPRHHVNALLNAYRDAGTASIKATAKIVEAAGHAKALDRERDCSRIETLAVRGGMGAGRPTMIPAVAAASNEPPGPVERILRELGVTDQVLLDRGLALDGATSLLVSEAAQQTAPQRWNVAVKDLRRHHDASQIINHVLAQNEAALTVRSSSRAAVARRPAPQPRPSQAQPEP